MQRHRVFLTGVGGQGTLTSTRLLALAAMDAGLAGVPGAIHGLAQRGGGVESLHGFGEGGVSRPLIVFSLFSLALTVAALRLGGDPQRDSLPLPGLVSLPGALVVLAWLFTALSLVVILGTMWPVISTLWSAKSVGLEAGFYNRACNPLFAMVALLLIVCPWLSWKEGLRDRGAAAGLGVFSLIVGVVLYVSGMTHPVALAAAVGAIGALAGIVLLFVRDRAPRRAQGGLRGSLVHAGAGRFVLGRAALRPSASAQEAAPVSDDAPGPPLRRPGGGRPPARV